MNVVRLVVEHHQLRQTRQKLQHIAACVTAVQHVQAVARGAARRERQHRVDDMLRLQRRAKRLDVFNVCFNVQRITVIEQMPVGDRNHPVAGGLQANLGFAAHVAAHKRKHAFPVSVRNEQVGK